MPRRRPHVWRTHIVKGKRQPDYCEACGIDRTPETERQSCRPTRIF